MQQFFSCCRVKHSKRQKPTMIFLVNAAPSQLFPPLLSCRAQVETSLTFCSGYLEIPRLRSGMTERRRDPAIRFSAHESLRPSREYGLKIRTLFFPRNHANIDVLEAGVFQKLVQLHFAETEPVISVKLARPLEGMVQQIENHNAPILSQNGMRALDRAFRPRSMVQSLTENRQIDTVRGNGRLLHITEPVLDVAEAMFLRQLRRELDHLRRIIDRNDFTRIFGEQLRQGAFTCTYIRHS